MPKKKKESQCGNDATEVKAWAETEMQNHNISCASICRVQNDARLSSVNKSLQCVEETQIERFHMLLFVCFDFVMLEIIELISYARPDISLANVVYSHSGINSDRDSFFTF